ncbi:peptidoglycan-binding domain-containing protein [Aureimonas fodinaquatilis]|uniref:peptidoglycan-binding domain-containing protein n=1 Tax=Aureimonas fodinaquatilis TaxID=2565783 RepID=UPI00165DF22E|nr:peptidoglycan-binding protein [Aureimonas fodinaquatilis]
MREVFGLLMSLIVAGIVAATSAFARRPAFYSGAAAFVILCVMIGSNAFRQEATSTAPILATRMDTTVPVVGALPEVAVEEVAAEPWRPTNDPRVMSVPLVREVQQLLKEEGYYKGAIDGRPGQATDLAIREFQASQGLKVDGVIEPMLLIQIRQLLAVSPTPGGDDRSLEERVAELNAEPQPDRELVRQIQAALTNAKVAELKADGIAGEQTRAAIRVFQATAGLNVTGEPDGAVLERLTQLGAVN